MAEDGLMSGAGATFFLTSLLDHPDFDPDVHLPLMRAHRARRARPCPRRSPTGRTPIGISIVRMYGSTEHPSITGSTHDDPFDKRARTDGRPLLGCEIRLADDGEIFSRGPDCFAGYTDPALTDGRVRSTTVGTARRTSACSTTTAISRSPIARRT